MRAHAFVEDSDDLGGHRVGGALDRVAGDARATDDAAPAMLGAVLPDAVVVTTCGVTAGCPRDYGRCRACA